MYTFISEKTKGLFPFVFEDYVPVHDSMRLQLVSQNVPTNTLMPIAYPWRAYFKVFIDKRIMWTVFRGELL